MSEHRPIMPTVAAIIAVVSALAGAGVTYGAAVANTHAVDTDQERRISKLESQINVVNRIDRKVQRLGDKMGISFEGIE